MKNSTAYSDAGSRRTKSIASAPYSIQLLWREANEKGAAIIRVRSRGERWDDTDGATFSGVHRGLVSVYTPHKKPSKKLWFKKLLGRKETNPSMQILEVPNSFYDIEDVLSILNPTR